MNKKHMTRLLLVTTIAVVLFIALLPKSSIHAQETNLGEVALSNTLYDKGNEIISSIPAQNFGEYDIGSGFSNVQRVELRDANGNVVKQLPNTSGTKYDIGTIDYNSTVRVVSPSDSPAEIDEGYFEWFRDPNKYVWMYDIDDGIHPPRTYRDTRWSVYNRPPPDAKEATSVYDQNGTPLTGTGAVAWAKRAGTLTPPVMQIDGTSDVVPFNAISGLKFSSSDFSINLDKDRNLKTSNITRLETLSLDPNTLLYSFIFEANYDFEPDQVMSDDTNGRVIRYYNSWKIGIEGYVYKYQKLYLWVVHGNAPSPSPGGNSPSPTPTPTPDNGPEVITGDFTIEKPTMTVRESNRITPIGVSVSGGNGSSLKEFTFTATQGTNSKVVFSSNANSQDYLYQAPFPSGFGVGTVQMTMKITSTSGASKTVGPKSFNVIPDPTNGPPTLKVAWVKSSSSTKAVEDAFIGDKLYFKILNVSDPDGDTVTTTWEIENGDSWIQGLPAKYGWDAPYTKKWYGPITMDEDGTVEVCAKAVDEWGEETTDCASVDVDSPNPIPKITGPDIVKEGHILEPLLSSEKSYTKVPGRTIDHSRDIWTNKKDSYDVVGTEEVRLEVFDNTGMKSLRPDFHTITVIPDQPPVPDLSYSSTMVRNRAYSLQNLSRSDDGDKIETYQVSWGYDASNDGNVDPTANVISTSSDKFEFNPPLVGRYCFRVYVKEVDYNGHTGKSAYKDYTVDVINDAPNVSFTVSGVNTDPQPPSVASFAPDTFLTWSNTSLDTGALSKSYWHTTTSGSIMSGFRSPFFDTGQNQNYAMVPQTKLSDLSSQTLPDHSAPYGYKNDQVIAYLGSKTFIIGNSSEVHLISPGFSKTLPSGYATAHVRKDIDRIYIVYDSSWSNYGGADVYTKQNVVEYKISDLIAGTINPLQQKNWELKDYSTTSGGPITAASPNRNLFMVNDNGFREIDTINRTIKHYSFDNLFTPYMVDTYTNIPAELWTEQVAGKRLWSKDKFGNYYSGLLDYMPDNNSDSYQTKIIKWDAVTGMPSLVTDQINMGYGYGSPSEIKFNATNDIARVYRGTFWGPDYIYINLTNGTMSSDLPTGYNSNFSDYTNIQNSQIGPYKLEWERGSDPDNITLWLKDSVKGTKIKQITDPIYGVSSMEYYVTNDGYILMDNKLYSFTPNDAQSAYSNEGNTMGQLYKGTSTKIYDGTINFRMRFTHLNYDLVPAGISFRNKTYRDMYRLEVTKSKVKLLKIQTGRKTVLGEATSTHSANTWYNYQINLSGNRIKIYENGSLVMNDIYDNTFSNGTIGPFAVMDGVEFSGISLMTTPAPGTYMTPDYAVVDTSVTYSKTYSDPENDPAYAAGTQWKYTHVDPYMFLDYYTTINGVWQSDGKTGKSSLDGQTRTSENLVFDRVGLYKIDYRVPDDPHPNHLLANGDNLFQNYSKYSDTYSRNLVVHRRPISLFELSLNGDGTVGWNDQSYDPDRCYNAGNCQSGYESNHGIMAKNYYYITPSGNQVKGKLVRPPEAGTYTVGMQVVDFQFAKSDWYVQTFYAPNPLPNSPPNVTLTYPNGTYDNPTRLATVRPTITWIQSDADPGTVFESVNIVIKDQYGNEVIRRDGLVQHTSSTTGSWLVDQDLPLGTKYQVQVQVSDGDSWSAWSNIGWMQTNSLPVATLTIPNGSQQNPTMTSTLTPEIRWNQWDEDSGTVFVSADVWIRDDSNQDFIIKNVPMNTTQDWWQWTVDQPMVSGSLYQVQVRVYDEKGAVSPWSNVGWMRANTPPAAVMTFPTGTYDNPTPGNPTPLITWTQIDPDPNTTFTKYRLLVRDESATVSYVDTTVDVNTQSSTGSYQVTEPLPAGIKVRVTVMVWDQYVNSPWATETWMLTNRPPTADFDWNPKPVYEGDIIQLTNLSSDPDGDALTYQWTIQDPDGKSSTQTEANPTITGALSGTYSVTLQATDSSGAVSSKTKVIEVVPLGITGNVLHTDAWEQNRKNYNLMLTGDPENPWAANQFLKGERFMLHAQTTTIDPMSTVKAVNVRVTFMPTGDITDLTPDPEQTIWNGDLWENDYIELDEGPADFLFEVMYSNGTTKATTVTVEMLDKTVEDYWKLKRDK